MNLTLLREFVSDDGSLVPFNWITVCFLIAGVTVAVLIVLEAALQATRIH